MPFCDESLDFLFLNRLNDSKTFFNENRSEYERLVLQPLRQLVTDIELSIHEIDPFLVCEPKVGKSISRIFRDTRFTHDKHIFRDVMWCTFYRDRKLFGSMPAFFFEFSPRCTRWGCGYYQCGTDLLEAMRDLIKADDKAYLKAKKALENQSVFELQDTAYKRTRHPDYPADKQKWLDQRNFCFLASTTDTDMLFADDLAARLAENFRAMLPMYELMQKAASRVVDASTANIVCR